MDRKKKELEERSNELIIIVYISTRGTRRDRRVDKNVNTYIDRGMRERKGSDIFLIRKLFAYPIKKSKDFQEI